MCPAGLFEGDLGCVEREERCECVGLERVLFCAKLRRRGEGRECIRDAQKKDAER